MTTVNIIWFRRDLRLHDNAALYHALKSGQPVVPIFIFDKNILEELEDKKDRRVEFIYDALLEMQETLVKTGSSLEVYHDKPLNVYKQLVKKYTIEKVFTNHDYEQYAIDRDAETATLLQEHGATLHTYKDQVVLEKAEVLKDDGNPYTVFTPYSRKWKAVLTDFHLKTYPTEKYFKHFYQSVANKIPSVESMGFEKTGEHFPSKTVRAEIIKHYKEQRDYPAIHGTSRLGVHLRFGTISIRELASKAKGLSEGYLNELIWRDFYHTILWHFPHVRKGISFKKSMILFNGVIMRKNSAPGVMDKPAILLLMQVCVN